MSTENVLATIPTTAGYIVVGVHDTITGRAAIRLGAEEARSRGTVLHLVHVWREIDWLPSMTVADMLNLPRSEQSAHGALENAVRQVHDYAPTVQVIPHFMPGSLFSVLLQESRNAALLVLGDRPEEEGPGVLGAWFLEHATCPVTIVDADGKVVRAR